MKKIILLSVFVIAVFASRAQDPLFEKGDKVLNLGVGLSYSRIPIYGALDFCIADGIAKKGSIGVGGYAGVSYYYYHYYNHSLYFNAGARGSFHYPFVDKLDTYAGVSLGFDTWYSSYIDFGSFVGARYYFKPNIAVFAELAYGGVGYLTGGIAFKF
jgi:hypothetical protein